MVLNSKMEIILYDVFDARNNTSIKSSKSISEAAGDILLLLSYYAEWIHSLFRMLQYIHLSDVDSLE